MTLYRCLGFILLCLSACGRVGGMVPLNEEARRSGIPRVDMVLYGVGHGPVTFTMPSGEVLQGSYNLMIGGGVVTASVVGVGPGGMETAIGTGVSSPFTSPFVMSAASPQGTSIVCEGSAGGVGHGNVVCQMSNGARYHMIF